ncbi:hypothetical protein [Sphingobacterium thalpophilum]|uniref:Protochlamydia outer membrane protein domain-containing protein n=1 Tax=Sphingobacterium thalpophilum TaxID=259 RepID=A0A4U9U7U8_9SPHI|nr:hypothetical protein [Sphingobacterium thalpophilum]VTR29020.1 Uncharacterised protein [Sphingobacterium thalpophilum]
MTYRIIIVLFAVSLFSKGYPQTTNSRISFFIDQTVSNYDWNVAGDIYGRNPTVLSELFFNDINYTAIGLFYSYLYKDEEFTFSCNVSNNGKGKLTDIDYLNDNRQNIYNYEEYKINSIIYSSFALTWRHSLHVRKFFTAFLSTNLNYERHHIPIIEEASNLDSYYNFSIKHLGLSSGLGFRKTLHFELQNTIYLSKLNTEGFWNLRSNFKNPSFTQNGTGWTNDVSFLVAYPYRNFSIGLKTHYKTSFFKKGTDITHMANGDEKTRLNEFNSNNLGANLYISFLL